MAFIFQMCPKVVRMAHSQYPLQQMVFGICDVCFMPTKRQATSGAGSVCQAAADVERCIPVTQEQHRRHKSII